MPFDRVRGHERLRSVLHAALERGRLPPALLFSGPEGVGKRTLAEELARAVVCAEDGCGRCGQCDRALRGIHPDIVRVVGTTKTSEISVDQLRELLPEIASRPFEGRARVFVFDADALNESSSNALLKILEEPPPTSHLVLLSAVPHGLLTTIRSRCQEFRFGPLPLAVVEEALRERGLSSDDARLRAAMSGGSLGVALALESEQWRTLRERLVQLLESWPAADALQRARVAEELGDREDLPLVLTVARAILRDVAALHAGVGDEAVANRDLLERLAPIASGPLGPAAAVVAEAFGRARDRLQGKVDGQDRQGGANPRITADVLLEEVAQLV